MPSFLDPFRKVYDWITGEEDIPEGDGGWDDRVAIAGIRAVRGARDVPVVGKVVDAGLAGAKANFLASGLVADIATAGIQSDISGKSIGEIVADSAESTMGEMAVTLFGPGQVETGPDQFQAQPSLLGSAFDIVPPTARGAVGAVAHPVINALDWTAEQAHEGLSTLILAGVIDASDTADFDLLNLDTWREAYRLANGTRDDPDDKAISLGQALYFGLSNTDIYDQEQYAETVSSPGFRLVSGTVDGLKQLYLDADILALGAMGKAAKYAKGGRKATKKVADAWLADESAGTVKTILGATFSEWSANIDRMADAHATRAADEVADKLVDEGNKLIEESSKLENELAELISNDPLLGAWIVEAARIEGDLPSVIHDRMDNILKTLKENEVEGGSFDLDALDGNDRRWLHKFTNEWSSSSTQATEQFLHGTLLLRRLAETGSLTKVEDLPQGWLVRGERLGGERQGHRATNARMRGGDSIADPRQLREGDEVDFGLASSSESLNIADSFGEFKYVFEGEVPTWRMSDLLNEGEMEHLVSGRFRVKGRFDPEDQTLPLPSEVGQRPVQNVFLPEDPQWDDLMFEMRRQHPDTNFEDFAEMVNAEVTFFRGEDMYVTQFNDVGEVVRIEKMGDLDVTDAPYDVGLAASGVPHVVLEYVGPLENFEPENLARLVNEERKVRELKRQGIDRLEAADQARNANLKGLTSPEDVEQLNREISELHAEQVHLNHALDDFNGTYGQGLFLDERGKPDIARFRSGSLEEQEAFLDALLDVDWDQAVADSLPRSAADAGGQIEDLDDLRAARGKELRAAASQIKLRARRIKQNLKKPGRELTEDINQLIDEVHKFADYSVGDLEDMNRFRSSFQADIDFQWELTQAAIKRGGSPEYLYRIMKDRLRRTWIDETTSTRPTPFKNTELSSLFFNGVATDELLEFVPESARTILDELYPGQQRPTVTKKVLKDGIEQRKIDIRNRLDELDRELTIESELLNRRVKARNEYIRERAPELEQAIYKRYFQSHPFGREISFLVARAPNDASRKWVMEILLGRESKFDEVEGVLRKLHDQREVLEGALDEANTFRVADDADEAGQLSLEWGQLADQDRIGTIVQDLLELQLTGQPARYASVFDALEKQQRIRDLLETPEMLEARIRDVTREIGAFEKLWELHNTLHRVPQNVNVWPAVEMMKKGLEIPRRSRLYRTSAFGKPIRLVTGIFDLRADRVSDMEDYNRSVENLNNMGRQIGMDEAEIRDWEARFSETLLATESDVAATQRFTIFEEMIDRGLEIIAKDYGIPEKHIKEMIQRAQDGRRNELAKLRGQNRARMGGSEDEVSTYLDGRTATMLHQSAFDGPRPQSVLLPDFTKIRRDLERLKQKELLPIGDEWQRMSNAARDAMDRINGYVKIGMVLRPAWMPRIMLLDEGLRGVMEFGGATWITEVTKNMSELRARYAERFEEFLKKRSVEPGTATHRALSAGAAAGVGAAVGGPVGAGLGMAGYAGWRFARNLGFLKDAGYGKLMMAKFGREMEFDHPLTVMQTLREKLSHANFIKDFIEESGIRDKWIGVAESWRTVDINDPGHLASWRNTINDLQRSQIAKKILKGWTDDRIVRWLETEARDILRQNPVNGSDPHEWVSGLRAGMEQLLNRGTPQGDALWDMIAEGNRVSTTELRKMFPVRESRPEINPPEWDWLMAGERPGLVKTWVNRAIENLSELPMDALMRNSLWNLYYKRHLNNAFERGVSEGKWANGISDAERAQMQNAAARYAFEQSKKMLYEHAARSEFSHMGRFLAQFLGPAEEAFKRWTGLIIENPQRFARLVKIFNGIKNTPMYEENSEGRGYIYFTLPESARGVLEDGWLFDGLAERGGEFRIPRNALNMVFNTDFYSGPGLRFIASELLKRKPEWESSLKWAVPFGISDEAYQNFLGSVPRNVMARIQKQSDDTYMSTFMGVIADWMVDIELGERNYNLDDAGDRKQFLADVQAATDDLYNFRIAASIFSPLPATPTSPYRQYIDEVRELKRTNPNDWFEIFYNRHGDEFLALTTSMTKVANGVPPTEHGVRQYKKFEELINQYPEWGSFIIGQDPANDSATQFSNAAYEWQKNQAASPGARISQRQYLTPDEFIESPDIRAGWLQYIQAMEWIDNKLGERGLTSTNDAGAEDLKQIKKNVISTLRERYPEWDEEFSNVDRRAWSRKLDAARAIASSDVGERPDGRALKKYLDLRDEYMSYVRARGAARSMTAQSNADIYSMFQQEVNYLLKTDPAFGPVYRRWLENDPLVIED